MGGVRGGMLALSCEGYGIGVYGGIIRSLKFNGMEQRHIPDILHWLVYSALDLDRMKRF